MMAGSFAAPTRRAPEACASAVACGPGVVEGGAVQQDVGALVEHRPQLHGVGVVGHDDGARGAGEAGGVGDTLRVVARGVGDDAAGALGVGHREQQVARAAGLEGAGALQVLVLDDDGGAGGPVERRGTPPPGVRTTMPSRRDWARPARRRWSAALPASLGVGGAVASIMNPA